MILLVGDTARPEFRATSDALERTGRLAAAPDLAAALSVLVKQAGRDTPVEAIVVVQARPGEHAAADLDRLRRVAPLAPVVVVLGPWCEGEGRSGSPLPGAVRAYWHQFPHRLPRELARLCGGAGSTWTLPTTAGDDDRALALAAAPLPAAEGVVVVASPEWEMRAWLAAAFRRRGQAVAEMHPAASTVVRGAVAGVFDASECRGDELEHLRRFAAMLRPARIVVLVDFPRAEDEEQILAAGASAILGKPLLLEDLYAA